MSFHILKNAGVLPQEVQLLREIDELKRKRKAIPDPKLRKGLAQIDEKTTELHLILERYRRRARGTT